MAEGFRGRVKACCGGKILSSNILQKSRIRKAEPFGGPTTKRKVRRARKGASELKGGGVGVGGGGVGGQRGGFGWGGGNDYRGDLPSPRSVGLKENTP